MSKIIHFGQGTGLSKSYRNISDEVTGCVEVVSLTGRKRIYTENGGKKLVLDEAPTIFLNQLRLRNGDFNTRTFLNYFESKGCEICERLLPKKTEYSAKIDLVSKVVEGNFPQREILSHESKIKMDSLRRMGYRIERKDNLSYS